MGPERVANPGPYHGSRCLTWKKIGTKNILLLQMLLLKLGTELQYYTILHIKKVVRIWGAFDCDFLDSCTALGLYWERSFWIPTIKCKEDVHPPWFIRDTSIVNGILNFVDHIYPGFCWVFPILVNLGPHHPRYRDGKVTWNDLNPVAVRKNVPIIGVWRPMFLGGLTSATLLQLHRFELSRQGLRWAMRTPMNTSCGFRGPTPTRWKWRFPPLTTLQYPGRWIGSNQHRVSTRFCWKAEIENNPLSGPWGSIDVG